MLSKPLIQFSVDGPGCVPSLIFRLRPNYGGGDKGNGNLLQKIPCTHCYTQFSLCCGRPLPTHTSSGDSWTLTGKSGSVSCGVTAPFSWVLVHKVLFVPSPRACFPSPMKFCNQIPWPPKSNSFGFSVPLPESQVGKSVVGP